MTPIDDMAFVGNPPLPGFRPKFPDEIHVSICFTWDRQEGERLAEAWAEQYPGVQVKIGGPAMDSCPNGFVPGFYVKQGVTFTTRGCNNNCPWCFVPEREGKLKEIYNFAPGYILNDNNILQASHAHLERVAKMLKAQKKPAIFSGGIDARCVDDWVAEWFRDIKIQEIFLAADTNGALRPLEKAMSKLSFLSRRKKRVYTMVGYGGETIDAATERLEAVWELGGLPFAQLYQPADHWIEYGDDWKRLSRAWSRPAIMFSMHSKGEV